jgi:hypothetical protein
MINLLPFEEKNRLILQKKEKMSIVIGLAVLISLICMILILLSIKFYIMSEADYQKSLLLQAEQQNQNKDGEILSGLTRLYNANLAQLASFYKKEIYFSSAVEIITNVEKPDGVKMLNFSIDRLPSGKIQMSVAGASDTRDNLLIFKQNIENEKKISDPKFSAESWISPKNANFSLTFQINENE